MSMLLDSGEDALVMSSKFVALGIVIESGDEAVREKSLLSTNIGKDSGFLGKCVKMVQWSSLNSNSHL